MKKTLMAVAVGAAFAAPSAFADVTISGAINMDVEIIKVGSASAAGVTNTIRTAAGQSGLTSTGIASNYSNVTISSTEFSELVSRFQWVMNFDAFHANTKSLPVWARQLLTASGVGVR